MRAMIFQVKRILEEYTVKQKEGLRLNAMELHKSKAVNFLKEN